MIDKGVICALKDGGSKVEVIPATSQGTVTVPLAVPDLLRGNLAVNTEVVYVMFDDNTGAILCRLDGKNEHTHEYTHGGLSSGKDETSGPVIK